MIDGFPRATPYLGLLMIVGTAAWILIGRIEVKWARFGWVNYSFVAILILRSLMPIFDVDSLSYHLPFLDWLYRRWELPLEQQGFLTTDPRRFFSGTEDFISIPGVLGNLPLYAGVMSGVLKCITFATIVSVIPKSIFFGIFAGFLMILDDHFLFSGQSCSIFLNPAFIGVAALACYFSLRTVLGHSWSLWTALSLLLQLTAIKYHGLYLLLPFGIALTFFAASRFRAPSRQQWLMIFSAILACFSVFGLNLLHTGSPLYPFSLGPFQAWRETPPQILGMYAVSHFWADLIQRHYRILTYPGNIALKMTAALFIPVTMAWLVGKRGLLPLGINRRSLTKGLLLFLVCAAWAILMTKLAPDEAQFAGRYPRYIFGVAIMGLCQVLFSAKKLLPSVCQGKSPRVFTAVLAPVTFVFTAAIIDRHAANIPLEFRPTWQDISKYLRGPHVTPSDLLGEAIYPHLSAEFHIANSFLIHCGHFIQDTSLGKNVILLADFNWPTYLGIRHAYRVYSVAAGAALSPTFQKFILFENEVVDPSKVLCRDSGYAVIERSR